MRVNLIAFTVGLLVLFVGSGVAQAGGGSDTSGEGFHCYSFFELPDGSFAQVMVNDSDPDEVIKKVDEAIAKYEEEEGGNLVLSAGNIAGTGCSGLDLGECPCFTLADLETFTDPFCSETEGKLGLTLSLHETLGCREATVRTGGAISKSATCISPSSGSKCSSIRQFIDQGEAESCEAIIRFEAEVRALHAPGTVRPARSPMGHSRRRLKPSAFDLGRKHAGQVQHDDSLQVDAVDRIAVLRQRRLMVYKGRLFRQAVAERQGVRPIRPLHDFQVWHVGIALTDSRWRRAGVLDHGHLVEVLPDFDLEFFVKLEDASDSTNSRRGKLAHAAESTVGKHR